MHTKHPAHTRMARQFTVEQLLHKVECAKSALAAFDCRKNRNWLDRVSGSLALRILNGWS